MSELWIESGREARGARPAQRRLTHDRRILLHALAAGLPAVLVAGVLLFTGDFSARAQWTLMLLIVGCWLGFCLAAREQVVYPLRTLSNLLAALREGDYSLRARAGHSDALSEVMREVNSMGRMLREQRLGAIEASALLRTVMREIDVAVFAFDERRRLKLINRAGERLLGKSAAALHHKTAAELGLERCLASAADRTLQMGFPGGSGRWGVRTNSFREQGEQHQLLVLSDLTKQLREEELTAWQRLVRVIGHELNNSLAPIQSIAGSLADLLRRGGDPAEVDRDLRQGLGVIGSRAEGLSRFMSSYARLAKLPEPMMGDVEVSEWVARTVGLETRRKANIRPGPRVDFRGDRDQLEQLLINLLKNAVEASAETGGRVEVGWTAESGLLRVEVCDEGPGLSSDANLFVPFFTTKPGGSGVGLVLCRKIVENHSGSLELTNRSDGPGCRATLTLPIADAP